MTKLSLTEQEELFAKDCKLINLRYEYTNYTGKEKWAVVTELTEKELRKKYPDIIKRYTPFVLLSMAQGEVITEYQNYEARERMRNLRFGHIFDINDEGFEEHHTEIAIDDDIIEKISMQEQSQKIREAIDTLTEIQKKRIIAYFFKEKSSREIAVSEGVNYSKVEKSINLALKKLKILLLEGVQIESPSSNK